MLLHKHFGVICSNLILWFSVPIDEVPYDPTISGRALSDCVAGHVEELLFEYLQYWFAYKKYLFRVKIRKSQDELLVELYLIR